MVRIVQNCPESSRIVRIVQNCQNRPESSRIVWIVQRDIMIRMVRMVRMVRIIRIVRIVQRARYWSEDAGRCQLAPPIRDSHWTHAPPIRVERTGQLMVYKSALYSYTCQHIKCTMIFCSFGCWKRNSVRFYKFWYDNFLADWNIQASF